MTVHYDVSVLGTASTDVALRWSQYGAIAAASCDLHNHTDYTEDAFVPASLLNAAGSLVNQLLPSPPGRDSKSAQVAVVKIPEASIASMHELGLIGAENRSKIETALESDNAKSAFQRLITHILGDFAISLDGFQTLGLYFQDDRTSFTTTVDGSSSKRIGLHVDNWDNLETSERFRARNRICINMGAEPRTFLFSPVTVSQIATIAPPSIGHGHHELSRWFLSSSADVPVCGLEVPPGWAYIAPTDNIIHDGQRLNRTTPDLTYTVLGRFRPYLEE